ncbi:DUF6591 domain-containing protein [uncultured Rikenella sp.]|mgnify:FL=1|uniref:DUF6591 domain-containing protein n=1 Tax=uncultured Rikenella sp. TaxID=368003 RepID=UPI00272AE945|nr:DUF6591 domain-containing protein [uncultured Rikenella sp.]
MKNFYFAAMTCLLCGCSGIPREREVTVADVEITGLLKDHVKVVDGSYKFTHNGDDAFITVKFELTQVNVGTEICRRKHPEGIRLNPIGETGEIFDTGVYGFTTSRTETTKLKEFLNTGSEGDTKSISFKWDYFGLNSEKKMAKTIFDQAVSFEVIDNTFGYDWSNDDIHWDDNPNVEYDGSNTTNHTSTSTSSGSNNWDKVLDEYEKYIDQYIELYRKAQSGDISALSAYAEMLEKAESYSEKLSRAEGSMSASQMSRYIKLTGKLSSAFTE